MRKLLLLTRILLKSGESTLSFSKKKKSNPLWVYGILALAFMPFVVMIGSFVSELYSVLSVIQQEGTILALGFMIVSVMIFFFGIFYVMNIFYFANDIETLLPLPLKPSQIMGAKFITVVIYEYFVAALIYLPLVISFGIQANSGFLYYLYACILFLSIPLLPLIFASVIVMIIMRFTNVAKNKDMMRIVGGLLAIVLALGGNFGIQYYTQRSLDTNQLQQLFTQKNGLIDIVTNYFPTSKFPAQSLVHWQDLNGLLNLLLFIGITGIALLLFLGLAEAIYFKGVSGISETSAKRKMYSEKEMKTLTQGNSPFLSLLLKEIRILLRTPAYFMNCIVSSFIVPIVLIIVLFVNPTGSIPLESLAMLVNEDANIGFVLAIFFTITVFLSSTNSVAATAVSREGKNLFVSKYLPISYKTQLWAKFASGAIVSSLNILFVAIIAYLFIKPTILLLLFIIVVMILGVIFHSLLGVLFDLYFPKLDWVNEQKAVKGNVNTLLSMFISIAIALGTVLLFSQFDFGQWAGFILLTILLLTFNFALTMLLQKRGGEWFQRIEE